MSTINITISGPAGSGKTTIAQRIQKSLDGMVHGVGSQMEPIKVFVPAFTGETENCIRRMAANCSRVVVIREEDERRLAPTADEYTPGSSVVELNGKRLEPASASVLKEQSLLQIERLREEVETWERRAIKEASACVDLRSQRDELLAALEGLVACIMETRGPNAREALIYAKAAVAAAKGGAA